MYVMHMMPQGRLSCDFEMVNQKVSRTAIEQDEKQKLHNYLMAKVPHLASAI